MYKATNNICPKYIADVFQRTDTKYPLRNKESVIPSRFNMITHGKHFINGYIALSYGIRLLPKKIEDLPTLSLFKQHILQLDLNSLLADAQCSNCTLCSA